MLERNFQAGLIKELKNMFPGCIILKNDAEYMQGFPDLTILFGEHWAVLECKRSIKEVEDDRYHEPNQDYYISKADEMSFASFICPENKKEVLHELQQAFRAGR